VFVIINIVGEVSVKSETEILQPPVSAPVTTAMSRDIVIQFVVVVNSGVKTILVIVAKEVFLFLSVISTFGAYKSFVL
jgi:hypothetical protein